MNRPKDPQQDIIDFIDDPNTIKKAVGGSMDKRLKVLAKAELLSELKKELPRKQKLVLRQTKLTDYQLGYNAAHKEVVSVIERYISQTKDSDIPETNVYQDDREGN